MDKTSNKCFIQFSLSDPENQEAIKIVYQASNVYFTFFRRKQINAVRPSWTIQCNSVVEDDHTMKFFPNHNYVIRDDSIYLPYPFDNTGKEKWDPDWKDGEDLKIDDFDDIVMTFDVTGRRRAFPESFAPPLKETVMAFDYYTQGRQFASVSQLFESGRLKNWLKPGEAVFLELYDVIAQVPVGKYKLYFEGFMTGVDTATTLSFQLKKGRYQFKYLSKGKSTEPLFSGRKDVKYLQNAVMASLLN